MRVFLLRDRAPRWLLAVAALCIAAGAVAAPPVRHMVMREALAISRPGSDLALFLKLNGSPLRVGVIISAAGASTTNAGTATPFTMNAGEAYDVICDAAAFCIEGSSASTSYTNASFGAPQAAATERFWLMNYGSTLSATTTFACVGAAAFNCAVFQMR